MLKVKYCGKFLKNGNHHLQNIFNQQNRVLPCRMCHTSDSNKKEISSTDNQSKPKTIPTQLTAGQQVAQQKKEIGIKVRRYGLSRYLHFVQGFEKTLETNFPSAMHVYRVFSVGIREFYNDIKHFIKVARTVNSHGFKLLSRKEIELYYQMPKDMLKVAPVLVVAALPFANYVVFPLAYMFPRQLLSSHFWSLLQRTDFAVDSLKRRLYNQRPVFRCLQARLEDIESPELFHKWRHVLGLLGSGVHPDPKEIIEIKPLFMSEPYHLTSLYSNHVNGLLRLHNMHMGWRRRKRLKDRALIIQEMDLAMDREGVAIMTLDELRWACFLRGLNPTTMKTEDMINWLQRWIVISQVVDEDSASLLLHTPILLGYNEPSNWVLIY